MYTRWGSRSCPRNGVTELVYSGIMGGNYWNNKGGGANFFCMPKDPEYKLRYQPGVRGHLFINGVSYYYPLRGGRNGRQVACAVCYVKGKTTTLMIPAKASCPSSWTRQYYGYIMTEQKGSNSNNRYMYECIDQNMEVVHKPHNNHHGVGIFHAEVLCGHGLPCGHNKYNNYKELNCVMCAK